MKTILLSIVTAFLVTPIMSQKADYSVFTGKGEPSSMAAIVAASESVNVVFLGEMHDDSVGHRLQSELFLKIIEKYGRKRSVVLSLEMFEKDVQASVDEYLTGLIPEKQFLASSRPWGNYETDYRPLVETARERKLKVLAANAPRRYVNMVSRLGRESLEKLSPEARSWLPPLPYGQPSAEYAAKFNNLMSGMSEGAGPAAHNPIVNSQALWDASMAHSISEVLKSEEKPLVVHLNGSFHTESRMGIPEHLVKYRSGTKFIVVTIRYEPDFESFDQAKHANLGDFVILTDSKAPRSKR